MLVWAENFGGWFGLCDCNHFQTVVFSLFLHLFHMSLLEDSYLQETKQDRTTFNMPFPLLQITHWLTIQVKIP